MAGGDASRDDHEALQQVRGELLGPAPAAAQGKKYPILYCTLYNRFYVLLLYTVHITGSLHLSCTVLSQGDRGHADEQARGGPPELPHNPGLRLHRRQPDQQRIRQVIASHGYRSFFFNQQTQYIIILLSYIINSIY